MAMFARVFTTWTPPEEAKPEDQRLSLEQRWKAGAMNAADLLAHFKETGGRVEGMGPGA